MEYVAEQFDVGHVTVKIINDDDFVGWSHHMGDEPIDVFGYGRGGDWSIYEGGADVPDMKTCRNIYDDDWQEIVACNVQDFMEKDIGRVVVYHECYSRAVTYASMRNAARGVLRRQGYDLDSIRVESLSSQRDYIFCAWNQIQLDRYAGVKNANAFTDHIQHVLDNDIWGFVIEDSDGEHLDSCWGFVGDCDDEHLLSQARAAAEYQSGIIAARVASEIEESRSDMVPA